MSYRFIVYFLVILSIVSLNKSVNILTNLKSYRKTVISIISSSAIAFSTFECPVYVSAKSEIPPLEKCFDIIRNELKEAKSLNRLKEDIDNSKWDDILSFTKEYDAEFRGFILKSAWKQMDEKKDKGIEISNSLTYDLIALNKAARKKDSADARIRLDQVKQDIVDFLTLEK